MDSGWPVHVFFFQLQFRKSPINSHVHVCGRKRGIKIPTDWNCSLSDLLMQSAGLIWWDDGYCDSPEAIIFMGDWFPRFILLRMTNGLDWLNLISFLSFKHPNVYFKYGHLADGRLAGLKSGTSHANRGKWNRRETRRWKSRRWEEHSRNIPGGCLFWFSYHMKVPILISWVWYLRKRKRLEWRKINKIKVLKDVMSWLGSFYMRINSRFYLE